MLTIGSDVGEYTVCWVMCSQWVHLQCEEVMYLYNYVVHIM